MAVKKSPQRPLSTAVGILAVLLVVGGGVYGYQAWKNTQTPPITTVQPAYQALLVRKQDQTIAYIRHQNGQLTVEGPATELTATITTKLRLWETQTLEYPIGGQSADGALWDGTAQTTIEQSDFLIGIMVLLEKELGSDYQLTLIK